MFTAIYHPIVTVMLLAHAAVGCEVGINKMWGNLDLGFFWNDAINSLGFLMQHTRQIAIFSPKRRNSFTTISRKVRSLYLRLLHG